jgi:hypothetical protein
MATINDRLQRVEQRVADRVERGRLDFLRAKIFYQTDLISGVQVELPIQSFEDLGQDVKLAEQLGFVLESGSRMVRVLVPLNWLELNRYLLRGYTWKIQQSKTSPLKTAAVKGYNLTPNDPTTATLTLVEFTNING